MRNGANKQKYVKNIPPTYRFSKEGKFRYREENDKNARGIHEQDIKIERNGYISKTGEEVREAYSHRLFVHRKIGRKSKNLKFK